MKQRRRWGRLFWSTRPIARGSKAVLESAAPFDARGMRSIFRRGDQFPGLPAYSMGMWLAKDGRLLVRFSSRGSCVEPRSYQVHQFRIDPRCVPTLTGDNEVNRTGFRREPIC